MANVKLNEYEVQLVRFFAKHYEEKDRWVALADIPDFADKEKFGAAYDRLIRFGYVISDSSCGLEILPPCLEAVETWDNPPLPDRWDEATKWFRSKRWSLPVLVLAVGLPALKGWVDVIKMLLEWVGIMHGSK
jgi:hypothetical protein